MVGASGTVTSASWTENPDHEAAMAQGILRTHNSGCPFFSILHGLVLE